MWATKNKRGYMEISQCEYPGCTYRARVKGLCTKHYNYRYYNKKNKRGKK